MRVIVVNPGEPPVVQEIEGDLASLQDCVDGDIERFAVDGHVEFVANEEGRINGMEFNRFVILSDGSVWDIFGPLLLVGGNDETGEFESLTDADVAQWMPRLAEIRFN